MTRGKTGPPRCSACARCTYRHCLPCRTHDTLPLYVLLKIFAVPGMIFYDGLQFWVTSIDIAWAVRCSIDRVDRDWAQETQSPQSIVVDDDDLSMYQIKTSAKLGFAPLDRLLAHWQVLRSVSFLRPPGKMPHVSNGHGKSDVDICILRSELPWVVVPVDEISKTISNSA